MSAPTIRTIEPRDDVQMANVIRTVMPEFGADGPGFAIHDPEVSFMSRAYGRPRCVYFVVEDDGRVLGGGGVAPLDGGDADTCELRKMYFLPELRGRGVGRAVLERCIEAARAMGYRRMYLETLTGMDGAMRLYEKLGFLRIACSKGATGHHGCDTFYEREL
ncbi:GNAT family N-acetyltransferase [Sandaracinus amylolyticus]|uniref:GNAT family N-acetyltransferase n=1 Tax=Sandaracinus amylolyticus TaxID=927083 RepID=UPI001F167269|nr:GNAT family N-acetyltransferase [Sandaracinus amylolyticus]UJR79931.1 Acetyltransferase, N-acetylglutamate synthase [Sandaracinus amylolyticus]